MTHSLPEAEGRLGAAGVRPELELERRKAATRRAAPLGQPLDVEEVLNALHAYERAAATRGIAFLTMRRIGEVLGLSAGSLRQFRMALRRSHHPQYRPPVWVIEAP